GHHLLEWDPDDFRIFCGDLGNEVNDDILARAFSRYPSFLKAKVIRDKQTGKTKGYGFVSFKDPNDYIRAMREMNGKYVGSCPIKLQTGSHLPRWLCCWGASWVALPPPSPLSCMTAPGLGQIPPWTFWCFQGCSLSTG
uniref:RNA-binding protein 42 n=1 Tax=Pelusios castaneus TaxID=367368 RepID=A0A8C8S0K8_9SAUR